MRNTPSEAIQCVACAVWIRSKQPRCVATFFVANHAQWQAPATLPPVSNRVVVACLNTVPAAATAVGEQRGYVSFAAHVHLGLILKALQKVVSNVCKKTEYGVGRSGTCPLHSLLGMYGCVN